MRRQISLRQVGFQNCFGCRDSGESKKSISCICRSGSSINSRPLNGCFHAFRLAVNMLLSPKPLVVWKIESPTRNFRSALQFLLNDEPGASLELGIHLRKIMPDDTEAKKLYSAQHIHRNHGRSPARHDRGMKNLRAQGPNSQPEADQRNDHAEKCDEFEGSLTE